MSFLLKKKKKRKEYNLLAALVNLRNENCKSDQNLTQLRGWAVRPKPIFYPLCILEIATLKQTEKTGKGKQSRERDTQKILKLLEVLHPPEQILRPSLIVWTAVSCEFISSVVHYSLFTCSQMTPSVPLSAT